MVEEEEKVEIVKDNYIPTLKVDENLEV